MIYPQLYILIASNSIYHKVALNSNASETILLINGAGAQLDKLLALDCGAISYPTTNRSMIGGGGGEGLPRVIQNN